MAIQEGSTALLATLMPSIEPVLSVSIVPREKYPMGQTVLRVNEARELNNMFTRRYLEEQLLMVMAGRAAEQVRRLRGNCGVIGVGFGAGVVRAIALLTVRVGAEMMTVSEYTRARNMPIGGQANQLCWILSRCFDSAQVVYGDDDVSTINQRRLVLARRIVTKLVVAGAMSDNPRIGPRTISHPVDKGGDRLLQVGAYPPPPPSSFPIETVSMPRCSRSFVLRFPVGVAAML